MSGNSKNANCHSLKSKLTYSNNLFCRTSTAALILWSRCNPFHRCWWAQLKSVKTAGVEDEDDDYDFAKHNLLLCLLDDCGPKLAKRVMGDIHPLIASSIRSHPLPFSSKLFVFSTYCTIGAHMNNKRNIYMRYCVNFLICCSKKKCLRNQIFLILGLV